MHSTAHQAGAAPGSQAGTAHQAGADVTASQAGQAVAERSEAKHSSLAGGRIGGKTGQKARAKQAKEPESSRATRGGGHFPDEGGIGYAHAGFCR